MFAKLQILYFKGVILDLQNIRDWDRYSIKNRYASSVKLMYQAGLAIAEQFLKDKFSGPILVAVGPGNNGGDGILVAWFLLKLNFRVDILLLNHNKLSADAQYYFEKYKSAGGRVVSNCKYEAYEVIIDAILGTGTNRELSGAYLDVVNEINASKQTVIAIDIPSGLNGDSWGPRPSIVADHTYTLQGFKWCFANPELRQRFGKISILDIGLLADFKPTKIWAQLIGPEIFKAPEAKLWDREKRDARPVKLLGGASGMSGSIVFAAKAAMHTGASLLHFISESEQMQTLQCLAPEIMASEPTEMHFKKARTVWIAGPGLAGVEKAEERLQSVLSSPAEAMVLDADAINIIASNHWQALIPKNAILTPHQREFERLVGDFTSQEQRLELQLEFSQKYSCYLLYKGPHSCITSPEAEIFINPTGNGALAKGGSGDVLSGMIAGFLAAKDQALIALQRAVFLHGAIADDYVKTKGVQSLTPQDLISAIPQKLKELNAGVAFC